MWSVSVRFVACGWGKGWFGGHALYCCDAAPLSSLLCFLPFFVVCMMAIRGRMDVNNDNVGHKDRCIQQSHINIVYHDHLFTVATLQLRRMEVATQTLPVVECRHRVVNACSHSGRR